MLKYITRRNFLTSTAATAIALNWPARLRAQNDATTVFTGGTILTVDKDFSEAEAIAVRGNKILAVGSLVSVQTAAGDSAITVDLGGRTLLPGFIDPHVHFTSGAVLAGTSEYVGASRFRSAKEILAHLTKIGKQKPKGEWIVARNYDPTLQEGPDALTFKELDAVSTDHPVFILNSSGHLAYVNAKAYEAAGITADVEDPPGAEFVRDSDGNLNGIIKNNTAHLQVLQKSPDLMNADPVKLSLDLLDEWSALGLTTVGELALGGLTSSPADVAILDSAAKSGRMNVRVRAYAFYTIGAKEWDKAGINPGYGDELFRIVGYKLIADGSNQGFTGLQREPYIGTDNHGLAYVSPEELTELATERAEKGWQLAIHGNGDAGIDNILDTCQAMRDNGIDLGKIRPRIEHCSILHDDQIARMKDLGVSASFLIGHVHFWGVAMRDDVFGEEKAKLLDRCRSLEKAGVGYTLQSDFFVTDPDPLHMIEMAVTRKTWKEPDYVLAPDETVPVESAIRAITSEAAWQLYSEHEVGSLEQGKLADMVILDKDPRSVDPDTIKDIKVMETWMDGKQVFKA